MNKIFQLAYVTFSSACCYSPVALLCLDLTFVTSYVFYIK